MQVDTGVEVFSMPDFFDSAAAVVVRAVAMFLFAVMLAHYLGE